MSSLSTTCTRSSPLSANGRIAFALGYRVERQLFVKFILVVAVLFVIVTPVVLLLITGERKLALITYTGAVRVWPPYKAIQVNAPRSYDPEQVPPELMPVRLNLPPRADPWLLDSSD